jgi:hypothetical protein
MTDWTTVSSLATGAGTLVLAIATFASVRSANRAARVAEQSLLVGLRPLLVASRLDDVTQKITYGDGKYERLEGGRGVAEIDNSNIYLGLSLRNAGSGIAVLHGWQVRVGRQGVDSQHPRLDEFHPHLRDIMIAPNDVGFWQAAFRDDTDPQYGATYAAIKSREILTVYVLYGDHEGGQRAISQFALQQAAADGPWLAAVTRHWNLDRADPR